MCPKKFSKKSVEFLGLYSLYSLHIASKKALEQFEANEKNLNPLLLYSTLLYATLLYSALVYATLRFSTLRYSTLLYATLIYSTSPTNRWEKSSVPVLQVVLVHYISQT